MRREGCSVICGCLSLHNLPAWAPCEAERLFQAFHLANSPPCTTQARQKTTIAHEDATPSAPPGANTALVVHGLLGTGRNWRTFVRRLAKEVEQRQGAEPWRFVLVDQRNHGASTALPGIHPPHDLAASAADLTDLVTGPSPHEAGHSGAAAGPDVPRPPLGGVSPRAVIGHSLGGKVVLEYLAQVVAGKRGVQLPSQVWVLDSHVGKIEAGAEVEDAERVLDEIRAIPLPVPSREALYRRLQERGFSEALRFWMGSNLVPLKGRTGFGWSFNLAGAAAMLHSYRLADYLSLLLRPPAGVTIHHVRAELSNRWTPASIAALEEARREAAAAAAEGRGGRTELHVLPDAGHWLHVDNPDGLLKLMAPHLAEPGSG